MPKLVHLTTSNKWMKPLTELQLLLQALVKTLNIIAKENTLYLTGNLDGENLKI